MRYIVGYAPNDRGKDAVALASALAQTQGAELEIVHVLDNPAPEDSEYPPERFVQELRTGTANEWLAEALAQVPDGVPASSRVAYAESFAEGLVEVAEATEAALIVVGATRHGPLGRFTIGSVANALLHSSTVPVALVPSGYHSAKTITRMTAAVGSREGADTLLDVAVESAARRHVPLRLVSLIALDFDGTQGDDFALKAARLHADTVLEQAAARVGDRTEVTATVAEGSTIEEAVESIPWDDGGIMIIGSSRLADRRKLFMGTTAHKILRALPVPLVVVPRVMDDEEHEPQPV